MKTVTLPDSAILDNLYVQGISQMDDPFEKQYIRVRTREKRMYDDDEVSDLPNMPASHPHYKEWLTRKWSSDKLISYLAAKNRPLRILEIGCGNGWLSFQLSKLKHSKVTGQDINFTELQQAARVFNGYTKLRFIYGDMFSGILSDRKFDIIIFAASIQYFSSLENILSLSVNRLNPGGEIHILDTHFYKPSELTGAKQRTESYYRSLGFPEMADYYFHHSLKKLTGFTYQLLHNPWSLQHKIFGSKNPFPWICIKRTGQ